MMVLNIVVLVFQVLLLVFSNQSTTQRARDIVIASNIIFVPITFALILQHWESMQHWRLPTAVRKMYITYNLTEPWKQFGPSFEIRTQKIKISTVVCNGSVVAGSANMQSHFHHLQMCNICKTNLLLNDTLPITKVIVNNSVSVGNCFKEL